MASNNDPIERRPTVGEDEDRAFKESLTKLLRDYRKELGGWSQQQLGSALGWPQQEVSSVERGDASGSQLHALQLLGAPIERLFSSDGHGGDPFFQALRQVESVRKAGVIAVYDSRRDALPVFTGFVRQERLGIDINASTLKGITVDRTTWDVIEQRAMEGTPVRIMLLHGAFSVLRAMVEGRDYKAIFAEGVEAQKRCQNLQERAGKNAEGESIVQIRIYLHCPTAFCIFLKSQRKGLLNPYTLGIEAYSTPTLLVQHTGEDSCMLHQFHEHHFSDAWCNKLGRNISVPTDDKTLSEEHMKRAIDLFTEALDFVTPKPDSSK